MKPPSKPFDPHYPYALSDDHYHRLTQLQGMLAVLTELTGNTQPDQQLDCKDLHHALWGLQDSLDTVVMHLE